MPASLQRTMRSMGKSSSFQAPSRRHILKTTPCGAGSLMLGRMWRWSFFRSGTANGMTATSLYVVSCSVQESARCGSACPITTIAGTRISSVRNISSPRVWAGLCTTHVRQSLEGAVDLQQLRFLWSPISPYPFIKRLRGSKRKMLALSCRYDLTFLPALSEQAYQEFDRCGLPYELAWLPCGHYTLGQFPFSAIAG